MSRHHVHAFPARMAPELALDKIELLTETGDTVLDPMCGSGTVVRLAAKEGRMAIGADLDPLAVLITRTSCKPNWSVGLQDRAADVARRAGRLGATLPAWIDGDAETAKFVRYWFAEPQRSDLSRLARVLIDAPRTDDPLRVVLSRVIVTKDGGASLARDTAHSRPHRVRDENDYDVFTEYVKAAKRLESLLLAADEPHLRVSVRRDDARSLTFVKAASVDLVVTSPPYLNAIDYLRGHRMSLVWMGWTVGELRALRGEAVGAERGLDSATEAIHRVAAAAIERMADLPARRQRMVLRFTRDIDRLTKSLARVIQPNGHLVMVVADSQLAGVPISNSAICAITAARHGFRLIDEALRPLPTRHRYLPPPSTTTTALAQRMKEEIVFTFARR